ncbi:MAG: hypothetical protein JW768_05290 [Chitinispirillaceae bacterium]|nr:hypothetical protein [Chitinispirillaceae bacterium]
MNAIKRIKTSSKQRKIDAIVKGQAFDDDAWELESEADSNTKPTPIRLSSRTIRRAKFFARIYKQRGYQSWLKRVIEDRINTEYEMYKKLKKHTENR